MEHSSSEFSKLRPRLDHQSQQQGELYVRPDRETRQQIKQERNPERWVTVCLEKLRIPGDLGERVFHQMLRPHGRACV